MMAILLGRDNKTF